MAVVYWIRAPHHTNMLIEGYIGVTTKHPKERYKQHIADSKRGSNLAIHRAIRKYENLMILEIIIEGSEEYCYQIEAKLRPSPSIGYNAAIGGNISPTTGTIHSPEVRKKISDFLKSDKNTQKGKPRSDSHRMKMSQRMSGAGNPMYGKSLSTAQKDRISKSLLGKSKSPESRKNYSAASLGNKNNMFGRRGYLDPKCNKSVWICAETIFNKFHSVGGCGTKKLCRLLDFKFPVNSLETIINKLKEGWNPVEDSDWLIFLVNNTARNPTND